MKPIEFCTIPGIAALCYGLVELLKRTFRNNACLKNAYPLIAALTGALLGVLLYLAEPQWMLTSSLLSSALAGMVSGLSATGGNELLRRMQRIGNGETVTDTQSGAPARYYITGDKHRHFKNLIAFCREHQLRPQDVVIILSDSGLNYYGDKRDDNLKRQLRELEVTFFCLHGNKENRPQNIPTYGIQTFCGGVVYYEPRFPNLFFAKDGEVYRFGKKDYMVIGGAHSVDKLRCLAEGLPCWEDEMPDDTTKALVETRLAARGNRIDGFLTHTCPISCLPTEMFISTARAAEDAKAAKARKKRRKEPVRYPLDIDRSTEEWLETLMRRTDFDTWYCGHYHVGKTLGKIRMLHREILPFGEDLREATDQ